MLLHFNLLTTTANHQVKPSSSRDLLALAGPETNCCPICWIRPLTGSFSARVFFSSSFMDDTTSSAAVTQHTQTPPPEFIFNSVHYNPSRARAWAASERAKALISPTARATTTTNCHVATIGQINSKQQHKDHRYWNLIISRLVFSTHTRRPPRPFSQHERRVYPPSLLLLPLLSFFPLPATHNPAPYAAGCWSAVPAAASGRLSAVLPGMQSSSRSASLGSRAPDLLLSGVAREDIFSLLPVQIQPNKHDALGTRCIFFLFTKIDA